jgi:hypothetical protein
MTWVIASLNIHELVEMFTGLRKSSSTELLENMISIADKVVDEERWMQSKQAWDFERDL